MVHDRLAPAPERQVVDRDRTDRRPALPRHASSVIAAHAASSRVWLARDVGDQRRSRATGAGLDVGVALLDTTRVLRRHLATLRALEHQHGRRRCGRCG